MDTRAPLVTLDNSTVQSLVQLFSNEVLLLFRVFKQALPTCTTYSGGYVFRVLPLDSFQTKLLTFPTQDFTKYKVFSESMSEIETIDN